MVQAMELYKDFMSYRKMKLSVIIPAYNEKSKIAFAIEKINSYLDGKAKDIESEVIVIDDGSKDETLEIVNSLKNKIPRLRVLNNRNNRGKGYTVKKGILSGSGDIFLFLDADLSTPIEETAKFLNEIERYDVLIGSRRTKGANVVIKQPWQRVFLGNCFSLLMKNLFDIDEIDDTQCGFKMFTKEAALKIFSNLTIERFSFDVEVLYLAYYFGFRVKQVPVTWYNNNKSSVKLLRDGLRMIIDIARIKSNHSREYVKYEKQK